MQVPNHIVQSPEWAEFKNAYGTKTVKCGEIYYSVHKIPWSPFFVAYCPKVNPFLIDWEKLADSLKGENCASINFDVPNVIKDTPEAKNAEELLTAHCIKSPKNTFAPHTILMDLTKSEADLLAAMHPKHRYNMKLAQRHGVQIERAKDANGFEDFWQLLQTTSISHKYYIHPKHYYQKIWEILSPKGLTHILTATYQGEPLASWMLFSYQNVLYYPYGGSAHKLQHLFPSNLLGWEAIKLGKELGCTTFDMWGATQQLDDRTNPWWGFTNFKLKFGGRLVTFIASYDLPVNEKVHKMFCLANNLRWKMLKLIR
ncbi:peptidoglycan bridge formation glycyltransferase FemA/FemB family protein [Patescibacteria group bacterium]|nr:peptidoglycan bridge formation glycyltransferase FemA/FemB family protein [Patescibacteria group bacterium]